MIDNINQEILKLWDQEFAHQPDNVFMPLIYPKLKQDAILFIGSNPSFSEKSFKTIIKNTTYSAFNIEEFLNYNNRKNFNIEVAEQIEIFARQKHTYFKKFADITNSTDLAWEHIDLFFYRITSQSELKRKFYPKKKLNDFGRKQVELSENLIIELRPKIIVIANAFVSELYLKELFKDKLKEVFSNKLGYHRLKINDRAVLFF